MARLRTILHEQGRQIDELRLESAGYKQRIASLEQCLEEEMTRRQASTVEYNTVQNSTVQYSALQYSQQYSNS